MRFGIDLGGTKTELVAIDTEGNEVYRRRVKTPASDYAAIIDAIVDLVETAERHLNVRGSVGVGAPGVLSPATGRMKNANTTCLNGRYLDRDLARALNREVRVANDANCFALSEAIDGAAEGANVVFGVIIGTGTGGGIVVNGSILVGPNAIAGEWGHNPLPWLSDDELRRRPCYCGKLGCIETFISGPGLSKTHALLTSEKLTAAEIGERARLQEQTAQKALSLYRGHLARALATVINVLDPDVIVFGGGLSRLELFCDELFEQVASYAFSDALNTRLVSALHGDSSGTRGAAWLWPKT